MRKAEILRKTGETDIALRLDLDGRGEGKIDTGSGFFDHMLTLFARHGGFDLDVKCEGDTHVDLHHSLEDIGICLGAALADALGDKAGIRRYGDITLPMDEALVLCAIDVSGRGLLAFDVKIPNARVGEFDTELVEEFLLAFTRRAGITVHIRLLAGANTHHIIEGCFKAFARALRAAVGIDPALAGQVPSTKGVL